MHIDCAEYCGVSHSTMRGEVHVLSADDYGAVARRPRAHPSASPPGADHGARRGRDAAVAARMLQLPYGRRAAAHRARRGRRSTLGRDARRRDHGRGRRGVPHAVDDGARWPRSSPGYKPVMPTYQGILSEPEAAALVEFIRSLAERRPPLRGAPFRGSQPLGSAPAARCRAMTTAAARRRARRPRRGAPGTRRTSTSRTRYVRGSLTTDHKRIGVLYLVTTTSTLVLGGSSRSCSAPST